MEHLKPIKYKPLSNDRPLAEPNAKNSPTITIHQNHRQYLQKPCTSATFTGYELWPQPLKPMQNPLSASASRRELLSRSPQRISITIPWETHRRLTERSDEEGRSTSNLASYLLERGLA
jgi:hypothetical protein